MLVRGLIGNYCLKYEVHDQLATCFQHMQEEAMELQAYAAVADLCGSARGSNEWPTVCNWVCRLAQRTVAAHARAGRAVEAERAVAEGLAFAECHGLLLQRMVFLLASLQLALTRWDHPAADRAIALLNGLISDPAAAAVATAAAATAAGITTSVAGGGAGDGGAGPTGSPALDAATYQWLVLHYNLMQVLYMLRLGKVTDLSKATPGQQQQAQGQGQVQGPPEPAVPPPVLNQLDTTLAQLNGLLQARAAQQTTQQQSARGPGQGLLPYDLPGLPTLEPLVCLVCASALRIGCTEQWRALTQAYLKRGLTSTSAMLASFGVHVGAADAAAGAGGAAGLPAGAAGAAGEREAELVGEESLAPQLLGRVRPALVLHVLLLECRAQIMILKAELLAAREQVMACQRLVELFPRLLAPLRPGVQLLTGQYCLAVGETAAATAHFQLARKCATSRPAAAIAAVLEAEAHLAGGPMVGGPTDGRQELEQEGAAVARALAALGPFYTDAHGAAPGIAAGGSGSGLPGSLGYLEDAACLMASAACLAQQGQMAPANQLLSRALKTAHRRLGYTQLVCAILSELAPTFLAQNDTHSAGEAISSAVTFSQSAGDLWAEAQGKRRLAAVLRQKGEEAKALAAATSANRRQQRITAAAAEAAADSGRHGYATCWGLGAVR